MPESSVGYLSPTSLEEALELVNQYGEDAKILAGGQSLVPMINLRLVRPALLLDLSRVPGLRYIRIADGTLRVGALTTHATLEDSALVHESCPLMTEAAHLIGHAQIRNRGTLGGSLAHADPAAEWPLVMTCLDARIHIRSADGDRVETLTDFLLTYFTTTLAANEIVVEIAIPLPPAGHGWSVQELSRRQGDFALASAAAVLTRGPDGTLSWVRMALGSVGAAPVDATELAQTVVGKIPTEAILRELSARIAESLEPDGDMHASPEYRRTLAAELTYRALAQAWERAAAAVPA